MSIEALTTADNTETIYYLDFGTIAVFKDFLISEIKEGTILGATEIKIIASLVRDHFEDGQDIGYISNRLFSYSIVPTDLHYMCESFGVPPRVALVSYTERAKKVARYEQNFWPMAVEHFEDLPSAKRWMKQSMTSICA